MLEIQAHINNISFPKTLEEVLWFVEENGCFNVEDIVIEADVDGSVEWTVPRWCKRGDIVFFMHTKTSNAIISRLKRELIETTEQYNSNDIEKLQQALRHGTELYNKYGGKIYAIGQVYGRSLIDNITEDIDLHWNSRIYANINNIYCLENPIDISEFNSFIKVSRQSAITPVFGKEFDLLKKIIINKNTVPTYFEDSISMAIPLSMINAKNWIEVTTKYRHSFFLENQFRTYYVDYLLECIGDKKEFYKECTCVKKGFNKSYVDNVILISNRYLSIEVKLNIELEKDLRSQVHKYCYLDRLVLDNKTGKEAENNKQIRDRVLVIDTNGIYWYIDNSQDIIKIYELNDIQNYNDIFTLKERICTDLKNS